MSGIRTLRRRHRYHLLVFPALVLLALVGCTQAGGEDTRGEQVDTAEVIEPPEGADEVAAEPDPSGDGHGEREEVEELAPRLPLPDVDEVVLHTPAEGVGTHPTLAWEAVPGAERYHVSVIDADGRTAWAWTTEGTEVILGGYQAPPPVHVRGPQLHGNMHWHVLARDAEEHVIAQSGLRPIAP